MTYMLEAQSTFPPQSGIFFAARRFVSKWTVLTAHRLAKVVHRPQLVPNRLD